MYLTVGIYLDDNATLDDARREEIRQCYDAAFDPPLGSTEQPASIQSIYSGQYLVTRYVGNDLGLNRWDEDTFLRKAVMSREETESYLADLLVETYRGIGGDLKRITKDVWG